RARRLGRISRVRAWRTLPLLAASACSPAAGGIEVPAGRTGTLIVAGVRNGRVAYARAFELRSPPPAFLGAPVPEGGGSVDVFALWYSCPLASFGLEAGPLPLVAMPAGRPLPKPSEILHSDYTGGDQSAWEPLAALPQVLVDLRVDRPPPNPC